MSDLRKSYKDSGVDVEEGYRAVSLMKDSVESTYSKRVLKSRAGFGGFFDLSNLQEFGIDEPVLVSGTDGVGTKLKLAFETGIFNTVGIDLVAMCVNDIICSGARPLFFLDYIGTGKLKAEEVSEIIKGVSEGCREANCSLIGGETAEMPGFYPAGEFDLAGFAVGVVDRKKIIDGANLKAGDKIIGLKSSGPHSNGYSLIRNIIFNKNKFSVYDLYNDTVLGKELLTPTKIYVKEVLSIVDKFEIKAMAHITGGGFNENVARILPKDLDAEINRNSWTAPKIFNSLAEWGNVDEDTMYAVFNMGIGFIIVVDSKDVDDVIKTLPESSGANIIGEIIEGSGEVRI